MGTKDRIISHGTYRILQKNPHLKIFFFLVSFSDVTNVLFFSSSLMPSSASLAPLHHSQFFYLGLKILYFFIMKSKFHYNCYLHILSGSYIPSQETSKAFLLNKYSNKIPGECNFPHLITLIIY